MTTNDGVQIEIFIQRPKTLKSQKAASYIYAHGGGAFSLTARYTIHHMAYTAINLDCVVFSVDYRKGPEVKAPRGQQDFVDGINHVIANATKYGIDPKKICIAGASGGGWIIGGATNLLVKANDVGKIKAVFMHTGMLSDETQNMPEDKLEVWDNKYGSTPVMMTAAYKLHATDFENQKNDDQLYPGRASDDILKKYPPTVIWTGEFDFLRRDNEAFGERLKKFGKLAAFSNMPGVFHGYHGANFDSNETKWFFEEEKLAFKTLVDC